MGQKPAELTQERVSGALRSKKEPLALGIREVRPENRMAAFLGLFIRCLGLDPKTVATQLLFFQI